jgi:hypothetical protein
MTGSDFRNPLHVIASGAKQSRSHKTKNWIASSQELLAMTGRDFRNPLHVIAGPYSAASRSISSSVCCSIWRGRPISTGWKNTAAAMVHISARNISFPMLDMLG